MDLPSKWWMKVQDVIFFDQPAEASWRIKQRFGHLPWWESFCLIRYEKYHESIALTKDLLTEERAKIILENYQLNGSSWYLVSIAKKYLSMGTSTKFDQQETNFKFTIYNRVIPK